MKNLIAFLVGIMISLGGIAIADVPSLPKVTTPKKATDTIVVYGNAAGVNGAGINWTELTRQTIAGVNWQAVNTSTNAINWDTFPLSTQP